jgi:hypothetical protein
MLEKAMRIVANYIVDDYQKQRAGLAQAQNLQAFPYTSNI